MGRGEYMLVQTDYHVAPRAFIEGIASALSPGWMAWLKAIHSLMHMGTKNFAVSNLQMAFDLQKCKINSLRKLPTIPWTTQYVMWALITLLQLHCVKQAERQSKETDRCEGTIY